MGNLLEPTDNNRCSIEQYLFDSINFNLPENTVRAFLRKRGVDGSASFCDFTDKGKIELVRADLYMWMVNGASVVGAVKDSDNGWSHSDGGYTLSKDDKRRLTAAANAIYKACGEEDSIVASVVRVHSFGIMGTRFTSDGTPVPRIIEK